MFVCSVFCMCGSLIVCMIVCSQTNMLTEVMSQSFCCSFRLKKDLPEKREK